MAALSDTLRAAGISARSAILVALLTVLGSLVVSGLTSYYAAQQASDSTVAQLTGDTRRSQTEFLRAERKQIYTQIVTEYGEVVSSVYDYHNFLKNSAEVPSRESVAPFQDSLSEKSRSFRILLDAVKIIGSDEASATTGDFENTLFTLVNAPDAGYMTWWLGVSSSYTEEPMDMYAKDFSDVYGRFLLIARYDMGSDDD